MKQMLLSILGILLIAGTVSASGYGYYGSYDSTRTKFVTQTYTQEYYSSPTETYYTSYSNIPTNTIYNSTNYGFWDSPAYYSGTYYPAYYYPYNYWNPIYLYQTVYYQPYYSGWGFNLWFWN